MARRARRGGGYRNNPYNRKHYQFTSRRRAALKRAQAISAKKRGVNKVKVGLMAVGGVAAVGAVAYMGRNTQAGKSVRRGVADSVMRFHPERSKFSNIKKARTVVQPGVKEATRVAGAVSPADTPHQPGHIGGATPAPYPHAPGHTPGNPATYTRTQLPDEDPNIVRTEMANEAAWKEHMGVFEKFADPTNPDIQRLVAGKSIPRSTYAKHLRKRNNEVRKSGGKAMSPLEMETHIDQMVAEGKLRTKVQGQAVPTRPNPRAVPRQTAPNSGMTQAEIDEALNATELPLKPILGTPTAKGGGRGAVGLGPAPAPYTVPGLGNAQSTFGTQVQGTGLTRGQKAAMTRARNKAAKAAADAKPAQTSSPQFSHATPHAPGLSSGDYEAAVQAGMNANPGMSRIEVEGKIFGALRDKADKIK